MHMLFSFFLSFVLSLRVYVLDVCRKMLGIQVRADFTWLCTV